MCFAPLAPVALGDGSYKLVPGKPLFEATAREAAKFLRVSTKSVYRLVHDGILKECSWPTPRSLRIPWASLYAHKEGTKDPEYWERVRENSHSNSFIFRF